MIELRPYQDTIVTAFEQKVIDGIRRIIIAAPTGSGKTLIASEIIKRYVTAFKNILCIAHRNELLTQARDKLKDFGVAAGIIKAGRDSDARPCAPVQVSGIQTLHARAVRARTMESPPADVIFIDEAHHVRAMTYQKIIEAYPNAIIVGLTATPCRGDGRGLGNVFEAMLECPQSARKRDGTPYSSGWAANQFRTKHGYFPPWSWNDEPTLVPSFATQRWIKSRQIAWAKRRSP
jgi:superfamily II DNA or RNA helicase